MSKLNINKKINLAKLGSSDDSFITSKSKSSSSHASLLQRAQKRSQFMAKTTGRLTLAELATMTKDVIEEESQDSVTNEILASS